MSIDGMEEMVDGGHEAADIVDRVALLDEFLQDVAERSITRQTTAPWGTSTPTPRRTLAQPNTTTPPTGHSNNGSNNNIRDHDDLRGLNINMNSELGRAGHGGHGPGGDLSTGEGDIHIRAVTTGIGSPEGAVNDIRDADAQVQEMQEEVLRMVDFLFNADRPLVDSCVQVLDKSRVVNVRARDTGRDIWLVQGSRGAPYLCLRHYCSCRSFQELIRRNPQPVLCKHLLAVRLAPALGMARQEEVDDDKFVQRMSNCDYG